MMTSPRPSIRTAITIQSKGHAIVSRDVPIPALQLDQLLVKTVAVSLNPSDWMLIDWSPRAGAIVGVDFAGIVEEIGLEVGGWNVGDRVAGFLNGGAFASHVLATAALCFHVPAAVPLSTASTLSLGITTSAQALYQSLRLPRPFSDESQALSTDRASSVLIYGAGTATGTLAVQLAKLSGMHVIAVCSPKIGSWIKSLGADAIFDYNDPNAPPQIRSLTFDKLTLAMDCIGSTQTASFCLSAFSTTEPCIYTSLIHLPSLPQTSNPNPNIMNHFTLVYTSFGKELRVKPGPNSELTVFKASQEDREFMEIFYREVVQRVVDEGMVKYMPVSAESKGSDVWENVLLGINDVRSGRRGKGEKVVVEVGNEGWKGWSI